MIVLRKRAAPTAPATTTRGKCVGIAETLSGTLNGANKVFYTTNDYQSGSISVLYNGQALHSPYDFLESGSNQVTFTEVAPWAEDKLKVNYEYESCIVADASGKVTLTIGISSRYVAFAEPFPDVDYVITHSISNVIDLYPAMYPSVVSSKTINGFTIDFSGNIDSNNYVLEWVAVGL